MVRCLQIAFALLLVARPARADVPSASDDDGTSAEVATTRAPRAVALSDLLDVVVQQSSELVRTAARIAVADADVMAAQAALGFGRDRSGNDGGRHPRRARRIRESRHEPQPTRHLDRLPFRRQRIELSKLLAPGPQRIAVGPDRQRAVTSRAQCMPQPSHFRQACEAIRRSQLERPAQRIEGSPMLKRHSSSRMPSAIHLSSRVGPEVRCRGGTHAPPPVSPPWFPPDSDGAGKVLGGLRQSVRYVNRNS